MKRHPSQSSCESHSVELEVARRSFLKATAAGALVAGTPWLKMVHGSPSQSSKAETIVGELFESLTDSQKSVVAKPFQDPLRSVVQANWHIVKTRIGDSFYTEKQKVLAKQIVKELTSEDGYDRILKQTEDDDGGIEAYSMAWFGSPKEKNFEWVVTGRHLTMRADGNSLDKVAFGGPIAYGHGEESAPQDNLFFYQTQQIQKVFEALNDGQRKQALVSGNGQSESQVTVKEDGRKYLGIAIADLKQDQLVVFENALGAILSPYREEDRTEAIELLKGTEGGLSNLHLAYFQDGDLEKDGVWDVWRIEGPKSVIHFRGAPHVHAFIHITG